MSIDAEIAALREDVEILKELVAELRGFEQPEPAKADEPLNQRLVRLTRPGEDPERWRRPWWVALELAAEDLGYGSGWGGDIPQEIRNRAKEILADAGYHPSGGGRSPNSMRGFTPDVAGQYESEYRKHVKKHGWGAEAWIHVPAAEHYGWHVDGTWPYMSDGLADRVREDMGGGEA